MMSEQACSRRFIEMMNDEWWKVYGILKKGKYRLYDLELSIIDLISLRKIYNTSHKLHYVKYYRSENSMKYHFIFLYSSSIHYTVSEKYFHYEFCLLRCIWETKKNIQNSCISFGIVANTWIFCTHRKYYTEAWTFWIGIFSRHFASFWVQETCIQWNEYQCRINEK